MTVFQQLWLLFHHFITMLYLFIKKNEENYFFFGYYSCLLTFFVVQNMATFIWAFTLYCNRLHTQLQRFVFYLKVKYQYFD